MSERSEALQQRIARLRDGFLAQLPDRLAQLRQLYAVLQAGAGTDATADELHRQLHSIKGTGASFGLARISEMAARGEVTARRLRDGAEGDNVAILADLAVLLDGLSTAVSEGAGHAPLDAPGFELPEGDGESTDVQSGRRLVYLCDDDPIQLRQLETQLGCFGYQTVGFTDTEALCGAVRRQRPDAVIMDIHFPDGDSHGTAVMAELQRDEAAPLPTIFISGRSDFDARLQAVQAGGGAYFSKPVNAMELVESLDSLTAANEPEPFRILVVDDEPAVAEYHVLLLREAGMVTAMVHEPEQVLEALYEFKPDLVLMDIYMPDCTGQELATVIRQVPEFLSLPIVYLSSETDSARQFSALRVGADGFLTKPIQPEQLVPEVGLRAERMRSLRSLMVRDSLTGLFNHTTTKQFLESAVHSAARHGEPLCFAMIDVDHFKSVNDTYGHPVGDQVLLALSRILRQRLRLSDVVGRYGGEEFAVLLHNLSAVEAARVLDDLREDFARVRFSSADGDFFCTFSCGIAAYPEFDNPTVLSQAADQALYQAKGRGRNLVVVNRACEKSKR